MRVGVAIGTFIKYILAFLLAFCAYTVSSQVSAQALFGGVSGVQIVANPSLPGPHSPVAISLDDYSVDAVGATISWFINDVENVDVRNERSIELMTGDVGEVLEVRVALTRTNAPSLSASLTLQPVAVDIILEAETYVPNFYNGRALPSTESTVRAIALVHSGNDLKESAYSYKWTLGSTVLMGGPAKGKNVVEMAVPRYSSDLLTLEVLDATGNTVGRNEVRLGARDPELHFYEYSPLRGLAEREIGDEHMLIGDSTTIYGEPYFTNARMDSRDATFDWKIDGTPVKNSEAPNAITLERVGQSGLADIGLSVTTLSRIPQYVSKSFRLIFQ